MSSQKSIGIKGIIMLLLLMIGIPLGLFLGNQKTINYQVNGTDVTATVIKLESVMLAQKYKKWVSVTYENKDSKQIKAHAINTVDVFENDTITGKVLPEYPEEVFMKPPIWVSIVTYGLAGLCFFGGLLTLIMMVRSGKTGEKLLRKERSPMPTLSGGNSLET